MRIIALVILGLGLACTHHAPTRTSTPAAQRHPAAIPAFLPAYVEVTLDGTVEHAPRIAFVDGSGAQRVALRTPAGVTVDGSSPEPFVRASGPVRIGGTLHEGDVLFEPAPGASALRAVAVLPLETYVAGVVAAEIGLWSAEPAELRALAVAARTFAVRALGVRGGASRISDGVLDQAYRGSYVPPPGSERGRAVRRRLDEAVRETSGTVLARGSLLADVRYHACCGGRTSDLLAVFRDEPDPRPGSRGVLCAPCEERAIAEFRAREPDPRRPLGWLATLAQEDLNRAARAAGLSPPMQSLRALEKDGGGRWLRAQLVGADGQEASLSANELRRAVGFGLLPSAWIVALRPLDGNQDGALLVQGRGRGHGVGLCQEALRDLAREGWNHPRILAHYLAGARLVRLPPAPQG